MTPSQRRMIVPVTSLVLGVLLLAATAFVTLRDQGRQGSAGPVIGGSFALIAQDGGIISDKDLLGKPHLVFFGYTNCPDICPTTLKEVSDIFEALGADKKVGALFITVDPERDTANVLKDYVSNFDKRIIGVTGPRASVEAAMKSYRVYARKVPGQGNDYSMDHSTIVYLMDKKGRFVSAFNINRPAKTAAQELAAYL